MLRKVTAMLLLLVTILCCVQSAAFAESRPTYLTDLEIYKRYGKFYFHTYEELPVSTNSNSKDITSYGWYRPEDNQGNIYTWGLHLDGPEEENYWVTYDLGRRYDTLTLTVACSAVAIGSPYAEGAHKSVTLWLDDEPLSLPVMSTNSRPKKIRINVEGVRFLKLEWTYAPGSNNVSVIYDPVLY